MRQPRAEGREKGSVLALVPAAFLVLILLGAIAVDSAVAYSGRQQLHDVLAAAANDAVTSALDDRSFYGEGGLLVDPAKVAGAVCASVRAQRPASLRNLTVAVSVDGPSVEVEGTAQVAVVFGRNIPGWDVRTVRAQASARLADSAAGANSTGTGSPPSLVRCG